MAALLHDVLDDTPVPYPALEAEFGPRVAGMVAQVSKLSAVNQMLRRDKRRGVITADPAYWWGGGWSPGGGHSYLWRGG
jgi:(p)ppGpp synthase/HD superfamily hydrolase